MDYIFVSGTGSAAPTGGSAVSPRHARFARRAAAGALAVLLLPGAVPVADLTVNVDNLRSAKGAVRLCLTADPDNFPACIDDADAVTRSVPASVHTLKLNALAHGDYAIAVIHDENNNKKLDTFIGIPKEGFGFSRNPPVRFGPPRFAAARFTLDGASDRENVKMRYLL